MRSSVEFEEKVRELLHGTDEDDTITSQQMPSVIAQISDWLDDLERAKEEDAIQLKALNQEQAKDKVINDIAGKYGLTLNQVVGLLDTCESANQQLDGTGIVAVPFWFHSQFLDFKELNEKLQVEAENLTETVARLPSHIKSMPEMSDLIDMPSRAGIITGNQRPYIAGVTGPRIGDEHLDLDNQY